MRSTGSGWDTQADYMYKNKYYKYIVDASARDGQAVWASYSTRGVRWSRLTKPGRLGGRKSRSIRLHQPRAGRVGTFPALAAVCSLLPKVGGGLRSAVHPGGAGDFGPEM